VLRLIPFASMPSPIPWQDEGDAFAGALSCASAFPCVAKSPAVTKAGQVRPCSGNSLCVYRPIPTFQEHTGAGRRLKAVGFNLARRTQLAQSAYFNAPS
jgi:hypothetical protein